MHRIALVCAAALLTGCASNASRVSTVVDAPPPAPVAIAPVPLEAPIVAPIHPRWDASARAPRIALQAGHWKAAEAPEEQAQLRVNGTSGGGRREWEINLEIARRTAALLEKQGFLVEVLPTTIPPGYRADLFIAIHADGSPSASTSGFRAAAPRNDATGKADGFVHVLESSYAETTGLPYYPLITNRMRGYYAFNYGYYQHALSPGTVGVILETGFLTSPRDRAVIVQDQERAAAGIALAVNRYFQLPAAEALWSSQAE